MKIGLVTVLFNSEKYLPEFVECLRSQDAVGIVALFIDNASPDGSASIVPELMSGSDIPYEVIYAGSNAGVAEGNNIGIRRAMELGCEWIGLVNNDIAFPPNAVSGLIASCGVTGASMCTPLITRYGSDRIWMAGGRITFTGGGLHFGEGRRLSEHACVPGWTLYAPTCFMMIAKEVFESVGYMDPRYFVYCDDSDFVFRAGMKGFRVYFEPSISIAHKVSGSTGGALSPFTIRYGTRNRVYFIRKHFPFLKRMVALALFKATRIKHLLVLDSPRRKILIDAIREGEKMPV